VRPGLIDDSSCTTKTREKEDERRRRGKKKNEERRRRRRSDVLEEHMPMIEKANENVERLYIPTKKEKKGA
jgi:hypothetical protein